MNANSPRLTRRVLLGGLGGVALAATLPACSPGQPTTNTTGGTSAGAMGGTLVIGTTVTASNVFPLNFNRYGGGDTAPGADLVFEGLFRISSKDGGQILPVLAEKVEHSEDGKTATYTLRKGVTWSDGEPFTSKDVQYTLASIYEAPVAPEDKDPDKFAWLSAPIEAPDDHTVIVHYHDDQRQQETNLALYYPIVPAHIYQKNPGEFIFPKTDTMSEPTGTGPYKLKNFQNQLVQYEKRTDYWGREVGPDEIQFVPAGQAGNIETQITQGNVDLSEGGAPGVVKGFATVAPTNQYTYVANGGSRGVVFQVQNEAGPMSDVNVRKAFRGSIDFEAVRDAAGVGYTLPNTSGVDPVIFESLQEAKFNSSIKLDAAQAKKDLEASAWSVNANGNLEKDGKEYPLAVQVQNDQATDMVTVPILVAQWKENLGVTVAFDPKPKDVMDGIVQMGEFDMAVLGLNFPGTPWSIFTMYDRDNHTTAAPGEKQTYTGNYGRYLWGQEARDAMAVLVSTLNFPENKAEISTAVQAIQRTLDADSPFIPYQGGGTGVMSSSKNFQPLPDPSTVDYFPRVGAPGNLNELLADVRLN